MPRGRGVGGGKMTHRLRRISDKEGYGSTPAVMRLNPDSTRLGRQSRTQPADYVLHSTRNPRMISRLHAELRCQDSKWYLIDHSLNGTYLNYKRPSTTELLQPGDILCFGHVNGYNIKPGQEVPPFKSELKFIFEKMPISDVTEENLLEYTGDDSDAGENDSKSPSSFRHTEVNGVKGSAGDSSSGAGDSGSEHSSSSSSSSDEEKEKPSNTAPAAVDTVVSSRLDVSDSSSSGSPAPVSTPSSVSRGRGGRGGSRRGRGAGVKRRRDGDTTLKAVGGKKPRPGDKPGVDTWHLVEEPCAAGGDCRKPADADIKWVGCDKCEAWYHLLCTRLSPRLTSRELESLDFICDKCSGVGRPTN